MSVYRSEHRIGEHNLQWLGFDVHRVVFPVSAALIVLIVALVIAFPQPAAGIFDAALGFITLGPRLNNNGDDLIDDRIDVVTKGFLALSVSCARCGRCA